MTAAGQLYRDLNAAGIRVVVSLNQMQGPELLLIAENPIQASLLFLDRAVDIEKHRDMLTLIALGQGVHRG